MLHQSEGAEPKDGDTRAGEGSPLAVEVHFDGFREYTVAALNSVTLDALSKITRLLGHVLEFVAWRSTISLIEAEELLVRASCCH